MAETDDERAPRAKRRRVFLENIVILVVGLLFAVICFVVLVVQLVELWIL